MENVKNISVIGTGTWGIALARMLYNCGHRVVAWSAIPAELEKLENTQTHPNLPGVTIPKGIIYTANIEDACKDMDVIVFAVPSVFVRSTAEKAAPFIKDGQIIVDVAKGIEPETLMTMSEIIEDVVAKADSSKKVHIVALSGPTHAEEVARDMITTIVAASDEPEIAEYIQKVFSNKIMRVYTNEDRKGVEICGATKNIMALASGIALGMGYGDNLKAALMTRGLAEIARLGMAMGCDGRTFAGLAGIGDLIVTATSIHSRNNRCGNLIGQGMTAKEAIKEVGMVVEGINAIPATLALAKKYSIEIPITEAVSKVVFENATPQEMVEHLMERDFTNELQ